MEENRQRLVRELREEVDKAQAFSTWAALQAYPGGAAIRAATKALAAYTKALEIESDDAELVESLAVMKALVEDTGSVLNQLHELERRFQAEVAPAVLKMNVAVLKHARKTSGVVATLGALEDMATAARIATGSTDTGRQHSRSTRGKKKPAEQPAGRGSQPKEQSLFDD